MSTSCATIMYLYNIKLCSIWNLANVCMWYFSVSGCACHAWTRRQPKASPNKIYNSNECRPDIILARNMRIQRQNNTRTESTVQCNFIWVYDEQVNVCLENHYSYLFGKHYEYVCLQSAKSITIAATETTWMFWTSSLIQYFIRHPHSIISTVGPLLLVLESVCYSHNIITNFTLNIFRGGVNGTQPAG